MIMWLDHWIYGNGHGMKSPYYDDTFYWLVDRRDHRKRDGRNGELYTFSGWFGCQLTSYQWTHPRAGETRRLAGRDFVVWRSDRSWGRVEVKWAMNLPDDLAKAQEALAALKNDLVNGIYD